MKSILHNWESRVLREPEKLQALRKEASDNGWVVVTTNGCFDLLHPGHVHILQEASRQGDLLIVGLNSDRSVRENKGDKRPLIPEMERAETILAFEGVDYVYIYEEKDCIRFVELAKPHIHVNDASYGEDCIESEAVREAGGRLHLLPKVDIPSTSEIIGRIVQLP